MIGGWDGYCLDLFTKTEMVGLDRFFLNTRPDKRVLKLSVGALLLLKCGIMAI